MIEAHIICSHPCDIPDLGIIGLKRGEERWISIAASQSSQDLLKEQAKGNVRVYRRVRRNSPTKAPRRPAPPFVAKSRPQSIERPQTEEKEPQVVEAHIDTDALAKKMKAELLGDLLPNIQDMLAQEVSKVLAAQEKTVPASPGPSSNAGLETEQLEAVLEGVLRRVGMGSRSVSPTGSPVESSSADLEDPIFVPSNIVDKNTKGRITISSKESAGADDLDDAQAILRKMKKAKQNKQKDNTEK